jgi:S1-C subfamily serine protease/Tfp pilus assembly protein PilF
MNLHVPSALLVLAVFSSSTAAAEFTATEVYQRTLSGTAWIVTPAKGKGTGWIIDRGRKRLITNFHVVADHDSADIFFPVRRDGRLVTERSYYTEHVRELRRAGLVVSGKVQRKDTARDLALIELEALPDGVSELKLAAAAPRPGDELQSLGNRRDLDQLWVCTTGHVRQTFRSEEGYFWHGRQLAKGAEVVLAGSPINEGDSGGPVVNSRGEVIGVAAAVRWQTRLASLCIEVAEVRAFLKEPAASEKAPPPTGAAEVYRKALSSVAVVKTSVSNGRGTAWVLDRERKLLITSAAAVGSPDFVDVIFPYAKDGRTVAEATYYRDNLRTLRESGHAQRGRVLARDPVRNLTLLEVEALPDGTAELSLADTVPDPGERLHALGNPNSIEALWVYAAGSVRQLGRSKVDPAEGSKEVRVIVAQLPLSDGDSGGPVLDDRGRLVGVVTGKDAPQQLVADLLDVREVRTFLEATRPLRQPRGADEALRRAAVYARLHLGARVVADCDAALKGDPKNVAALVQRAHGLLMIGDADRALADCDTALTCDPKSVTAYVCRADARNRKGEPGRAIADCDAVLKIEPKSAEAYRVRGDARRRQGDLTRALADLDEAIWLDANLAAAYLTRGLVRSAQGDQEKAANDLARAASLEPNDPTAWRALAEALRKKGDETAAKRADERARQAEEDTQPPKKNRPR